MPRILPLVGIAVGGVLAINALAGARDLPGMLNGARAFAEEAVKPAAKKGAGKKAAAPKRSAPSGACLFAWENSRRARPDPEGSKESAVARRGPTRAPP